MKWWHVRIVSAKDYRVEAVDEEQAQARALEQAEEDVSWDELLDVDATPEGNNEDG